MTKIRASEALMIADQKNPDFHFRTYKNGENIIYTIPCDPFPVWSAVPSRAPMTIYTRVWDNMILGWWNSEDPTWPKITGMNFLGLWVMQSNMWRGQWSTTTYPTNASHTGPFVASKDWESTSKDVLFVWIT